MDRFLVLLAVLAMTGLMAARWRARDGRVIASPAQSVSSGDKRTGNGTDLALAVSSRTPLVLVQFTAPDCAPCARTRVILDAAATGRDDLSVVAIDVADALDLARAHRIMRAPTTMLITADGRLLGRVTGVPRPNELAALLDDYDRVAA